MTICLGALAANRRAIVCVADKAVTWGETIQWESESTKIVGMGQSAAALTAGGDDSIGRLLSKLRSVDLNGNILGDCESKYKECFDEIVKIRFLNQSLLTRDEYVEAIIGGSINEFMLKMATAIQKYDMNCDFILCGFASDNPFLMQMTSPGLATDMLSNGFAAVGSGSERAFPHVLFNQHKDSDAVEKVLYDLFDAKVSAEMNIGVGAAWDAAIVTPNKMEMVPEEIKDLLEQLWNEFNYTPFEKRDRNDIPPPPTTWRSKLRKYVEGVMPSTAQTSEGQQ